jgi:hypothetical protein
MERHSARSVLIASCLFAVLIMFVDDKMFDEQDHDDDDDEFVLVLDRLWASSPIMKKRTLLKIKENKYI